MASIVDIANMALARFGHSTTISDLNESGNTAASVMRTFYPATRDMVLEDADWDFARKRVALALLPSTVTNWAYAYAYPADCITIRGLVLPGQRMQRKDQEIPFEVANVNGARAILTNMEQAEAIYTVRVEDPNLFPPLFVTALSDLLASRAVMPLSGKRELVADCLQTYSVFIGMAKARNLNQGEDGPEPMCEFLEVRQ